MLFRREIITGCILLLLLPCTKNTFAQNKQDSVVVLPLRIEVPANAKKIGSLKTGDNALSTTCDYEEIIRNAKEQAAGMGGNIVKITELVSPVFISKCYGIKADIYHVDTLPHYNKPQITDTAITTASGYASLFIYRLKDTLALEPSYDLHLNDDSVICKVKNRMYKEVKIYDTGMITLWAKTQQRQDLTLNIKPGNVYYLRCGLHHGDMRLMPFMELIDPQNGAYEYGKLSKAGKSQHGIEYLRQIH